jgi:mono/diheme cytochrome c family protein
MRWVVATVGLSLAACATSAEPTKATPASPAAPSSASAPSAPSSAAAPVADAAGQQAYARNCLSCHQSDGYGVPNMQPAITGGTWVQGDAKALALFVMTGGFNSAERKESESHNVMPAFRQLPDAELAAILTYIRQKFGKGASAVSAADIAAARASLP